MTISIGGAQYISDAMNGPQDLISTADQMMYEAKKAGKNRVCFYRKLPESR
jgi:PleD family two-component response regulator